MRHAVVVCVVLTGCMQLGSLDASWQPADTITGALAPELGPAPAPRRAPALLRVASWNTFMAADPDALAAELADSPLASADVILVQEIEDHPDEPGTRASRLAAALGMTWIYAPARVEGDHTHGDAILSRYPLTDVRVMRLPYVDQPVNAKERIAIGASVVVGERALPIVNVHQDTRIGAVDRVRQLDPAVHELPELALVGGDFNTLPWAWIDTLVPLTATEAVVGQDQAKILDDYLDSLGFASAIAPDTATYPAPICLRPDGLYLRGAPIVGAGVATAVEGSDHWPIWLDLAPTF